MKVCAYSMLLISGLAHQVAFSSEPVQLENEFDRKEVQWVTEVGNSTVRGQAFLKLKDGTFKGCAGFGIELLPIAKYSSERIFKTYGNNERGQILLEDNPPTFTPDAKEYHEMLLKTRCNERNEFFFSNVPSGSYYVMAFIIWDVIENGQTSKAGGGVMGRIDVKPNSENHIQLKVSESTPLKQ